MNIKVALAEDIPDLAKALEKKFKVFEGIELMYIVSNGLEMLEMLASKPSRCRTYGH